MNYRKNQLRHLISCIYDMISILSLDNNCRWNRIFVNILNRAEQLYYEGFTESELDALALSVVNLYSGIKSFSDYFPYEFDNGIGCFVPIPGTYNFAEVSHKLYESAKNLNISGVEFLLEIVNETWQENIAE